MRRAIDESVISTQSPSKSVFEESNKVGGERNKGAGDLSLIIEQVGD
jgi:hypothetical protein